MILMVIGWLVLVGLAGFCWYATFGLFMASLGFTGKVSGEVLVPAIPAVLLSWAVYATYPFHISINLVTG